MSNKEILTNVVDIAVSNGFKPTNFAWIPEDRKALLDYWFTADNYKAVIFNKGFAIAFWGGVGEQDCEYCGFRLAFPMQHPYPCPFAGLVNVPPLWKYHLQQMVIADDPIAYLGQHLTPTHPHQAKEQQ